MDLSVSKLIGTLHVENIIKGENIPATVGEHSNTPPDGSGSEIKSSTHEADQTSKGENSDLNMKGQNNKDVDKTVEVPNSSNTVDVSNVAKGGGMLEDEVEAPGDNEIGNKQPLIVIPPDFWLVQPQEVLPHSDVNVPENVTGGNANKDRDSEEGSASKHSVVSNVEDKVHTLFTNQAKQNKCFVPVERMSSKFIKSFQPSQKSPEIDPYSSLEDIGMDKNAPIPGDTLDIKPKIYNMRE